jgi:hypothetical protein
MLWAAAHGQVAPPSASFGARLQAIAAEHHGDVSLFAENLKTHETVAISPDTQCRPRR